MLLLQAFLANLPLVAEGGVRVAIPAAGVRGEGLTDLLRAGDGGRRSIGGRRWGGLGADGRRQGAGGARRTGVVGRRDLDLDLLALVSRL